jgi:hypothetical protein
MNRLFELPVLIGTLLWATAAAADAGFPRCAGCEERATAVDVGVQLKHYVCFTRKPERR